MAQPQTIRNIAGLTNDPSSIEDSALVIIDAQNTYVEGIMKLEGVESAIEECRRTLDAFRKAGRPIFHIRHDAGPGSPYDVSAENGQIVDLLKPIDGEPVITKNYPDSFAQTELDDLLKQAGVTNLVLVGFMTHMCVNSTARRAFTLGYNPTVIASATASRSLPSSTGGEALAAEAVHQVALSALSDLPAVIVKSLDDLPTA